MQTPEVRKDVLSGALTCVLGILTVGVGIYFLILRPRYFQKTFGERASTHDCSAISLHGLALFHLGQTMQFEASP